MRKVSIVMYHYVRDLENSRYPDIKGLEKKDFIRQLSFLQNHYSIISPDLLISAVNHDEKLPEKACMLTFDDGYLDHYTTVFPLLMERGISAFFSMPGRIIREHRLLDVNKIHYILAAANQNDLWNVFRTKLEKELSENSLPDISDYWNRLDLTSRFDPREIIFIKRMLQVELPEKLRNKVTDELYDEFVGIPENVMVNELYMSAEQMKLMKNSGMVFGIHGYDHAWLNRMTIEQAEEDLDKALDAMTGIVDRNSWIICYPYGSYSPDVEKIARNRGAELGITSQCRVADLDRDNPFTLPRFDTNDFPPKSENYLLYD